MGHPQRVARRGHHALGMVLLGLLLLLTVYLYQVGSLQHQFARVAGHIGLAAPLLPDDHTVLQSGALQAFFTTSSLTYPDKPAYRPASPLLQAVVADIDRARTSVELASFDFDIVEITDALLRAQRRGVLVRLIVDSENLDTPEVSAQTGRLQRAGIAVHFDRREPFMHNKFVVIDGAIAWTGSWNITTNDTFRNNNNMLRFVNRQIAADYMHEFEQMFSGRFGTSKLSATPFPHVRVGTARVAVYFAPEDGVAKFVLERLNAAKSSIYFMAFSYTADAIADAMVTKMQAHIPVHGVFETQNASGSGADFRRLRDGGVDVLMDGNCYILHHKVIVIDERTVITGSYNFTSSAERNNDENLVIVDDPGLARAYIAEFERVYAQAQAPARCS